MRKLLYSFLFFISPKILSKKSSTSNLGLLCVGMFFVVSFANAATFYSRTTGDWSSANTWSNTPTGGAGTSVPGANDTVFIQNGHIVTVSGPAGCLSLTFTGQSATLTVNSTLSIGGNIVLNSLTGNNTAATIGGSGSLTCNSILVGTDAEPTSSVTRTTILTSTISNMSISNDMKIASTIGSNTNRKINSAFNLASGTVNIEGQIITDNESTANISTFSMVTGAQSGTLLLGNTTPFSIDQTTDVINLNGTGSTVNYDRAGLQNVLGTTYNNLILSNGGAKTLTTATVANGAITLNDNSNLSMSTYLLTLNGNLVNNGSGTINGTSGGVTIAGGSAQSIAGFTTTGTVSMTKTSGTATFTGNVNGGGLTINGSNGTLNLGSSLTHTFTGNWTRTNGTLNASSSTLKIGGDVSGTGGTFTRGTSTVEFYKSGAQNLGTGGLTYYNLVLSGSGLKTFGAVTVVSNLWSIATGVQAALGSSVHSAGILTLGGAGPLTASWGSTSSSPSATNTNDTFFATGSSNSGRINITQTPPGSAIDNNYASYSVAGGISGDIAGTSGEYANPPSNTLPGSVTLTAPAGTVFINVKFASYGSPGGTSPNFTIGSCHAFNSRTVTTTLLGNTTATIPTSGKTFNEVFGDPCYGIVKSYNVVATYSTPICAGTNPGTITGSTPNGGNGGYSYLWEVSTTSATSGYSVAPGVSNEKNYDIPNVINVATWYRRTVTSGIYSDATIVVIPVNIPGQLSAPTSASVSASSVCAGTAVTLTVTGGTSGTNKGGYAEWTSGTCDGPVVGRSTLLDGSITITPTADTRYFVKYKNACGETACNTNVVTVSNPTSITLTPASSIVTTCSPSAVLPLSLSYSATKGSPTTYSIVWSTAANTAGFLNKTNTAFTPTTGNGAGIISNAFNVPANVAGGTYTGTLTVKTGSCVSFGNAISVTINPRPKAAVSGTTTICSGESTPISVALTGTPPWTISYSYGGTSGTFSTSSNPFTVNVNPTSSTTYSITGLSDATNCSAVAGDLTGNPIITVNNAPFIATQPSSSTICSGNNTSFSVVATGAGLTYKWQVSTNGGGSFSDLSDGGIYSNTATATMNITGATAAMDNYRYQVVITGTCSPALISNAVTLTVNKAPSITAQPSGSIICSGSDTTFGVTASGVGLTYKWQVSTNGGSSFSDLSDGGVYSNTSTATLNITGASVGMNNYQYHVVINGTCSPAVTSNAGVLTVKALPTTPTITKNNNVSCGGFGIITLTVLPADWTITQTGLTTGSRSFSGTDSSVPIQNLTIDTYSFTVKDNATGCTSNAATVAITDESSITEWTDSGWSNGEPDGSKSVVIKSVAVDQPFKSNKPNVVACSLTIDVPDNGPDVEIPSNVTLRITNIVKSNGKLVFKSGSSLVQKDNVQNDGDIVYIRATDVRRFDLTYWSSPIKSTKPEGFRMQDLSPTTYYDKYLYWSSDYKWATNLNGTLPMEVGKGYSIRGPQEFDNVGGGTFEGKFIGVPNNGNIDVTGVGIDKYFFLGNPYPSPIDVEKLWDANPDVLGPLYFWIHALLPQKAPGDNTARYSSNDYIICTASGSTDINGGTAPKSFGGFIAAGQGFFAKPKTTVIHFNNDMREGATENTNFFKTAKSSSIERNRIWLNIRNTEGAFKQILVGYIQGATNSVDFNYDAATLGANSFIDFYSINETKKLTIQGRALPFDDTDVVPLGYKSTIDSDFTIAIDHADGFFDKQEVYLEDKTTGKIINLRNENYTFSTLAGTFADRFVLRYTNKTLGTGDFENIEDSVLISVKNKVVSITSSKETIKDVNIFNVGAQLMYSKNKVNLSELQINNLHSSDQVLLVKVTLENGSTVSKKVVFSNLP